MNKKKIISIFAASFLVLSLLFLAVPDNSYSGINPMGCCDGLVGCSDCEFGPCALSEEFCQVLDGVELIPGEVCFEDQCITPSSNIGCCFNPANGGICEEVDLDQCEELEGTIWVPGVTCEETFDICQQQQSVPTLNEWGLIVLAGILGMISLIMVLKRKKEAA